jgi:hypothetical protein
MAQHLWRGMSLIRVCEVCLAHQFGKGSDWQPSVSPICSGDDDEGGGRRRTTRPRPMAPSGAPSRVLEPA